MSAAPQPAVRWPMRGMNPLYPWSDGQPMAENSVQYRWVVTIQGNLEWQVRDRPDVFVAADNLIYPVEGHPEVCQAPDVYAAFGVPKGDRGSYLVWEEGPFPQVVFEVRSPSNRSTQMSRKHLFYDQYGAEEYYDFDPARNRLRVYVRDDGALEEVPEADQYVSRRLGVRFDTTGKELVIYGPDGSRFLTRQELAARADAERQRADTAEQQVEQLRAKLRAAGIDPDAL